jgi:uncharacterized membrane protein YdfJ with MMPL/SSD domain
MSTTTLKCLFVLVLVLYGQLVATFLPLATPISKLQKKLGESYILLLILGTACYRPRNSP